MTSGIDRLAPLVAGLLIVAMIAAALVWGAHEVSGLVAAFGRNL